MTITIPASEGPTSPVCSYFTDFLGLILFPDNDFCLISVLFAQPLPPDDDFSDSHHLNSANKPTSLTTDVYRTSDSLNNLTSNGPMSTP